MLASKDPTRCGQRLRSGAFRQRLDVALDGTPQFMCPDPETELSVKGASGQRRPVAWFLAPIRSGNAAPVAALAMGVEADGELATIFSAARPGGTAEAYAFSKDGLMLTPSRFADELIAVGMLTDVAAVELRVPDPGSRSGREPAGGTRAGAGAGRAAADPGRRIGGRGARQAI